MDPAQAVQHMLSSELLLEFTYLLASILFIFGLKAMSHPDTARRGMFLAEGGMAAAIIGTLFHHDISLLRMDHCRADSRLDRGRGLGHLGSDDRHAATDRALPRLWRGCRRPGGHRGVHHARRHHDLFTRSALGLGSHARHADDYRLADRLPASCRA